MNKNQDLLKDFTDYCNAHPEERFWQALRNWSGFKYVLVNDTLELEIPKDTFHWEEKNS